MLFRFPTVSILTLLTLSFGVGCSTLKKADSVSSSNETENSSVSPSGDEEKILEPSEPADVVHVAEEEDGADEESDSEARPTSLKALSEDKVVLKNRILQVELESFGDEKQKTLGIYGNLKACRVKLASPAYEGDGTFFWDEPDDRISENWLSDGDREVKAFQAAVKVVELRKGHLQSELEACEKRLGGLSKKEGASLSATLTEGDGDNDERVHRFLCEYVKKGASLKEFLLQSFSRGILKIDHFNLSQEFLISSLQDSKQKNRSHGLMFMGWKLAYDKGKISLEEILFGNKDAAMINWTFPEKEKVSNHKVCLKKADGEWNP